MVRRIGEYDVQDMKEPTHQYDIHNYQDDSDRKIQQNTFSTIFFYISAHFHFQLFSRPKPQLARN
jgi:hypothetical protein